MENIVSNLNKASVNAKKIPIDQSPNGLRMLKFKIDALQILSTHIVNEYARINQNVVSYTEQVFKQFDRHYNKK